MGPEVAPSGRAGERTLVRQRGGTFLPGTPAEWTGIFVFAVGVYGATYRPITRHLAIWGLVPLDWFYLVLLVLGAGLMLFGGTAGAPHEPAPAPASGFSRFLGGLRLGTSLALVAILVWWAIVR